MNKNIIETIVGAIIANQNGEILLVTGPKWEGYFTIVGGHIDYGEKIEDALKRELKEEIGIVPDKIKFLSVNEAIFPKEFHRKAHFVFLNFVAWIKDQSKIKLCPREFTDSIWIKPDKALKEVRLKTSVQSVIKDYINKYF